MAPIVFFAGVVLAPAFLLLTLFIILRPRPIKIPIKGRHVFITGGSSGIGLAIARRAAMEGARVSILARDLARLRAARDDICRTTGAEVAIYSADVRDFAAVSEAVAAAGTIDLLVSNVGVGFGKVFKETTIEEIRCQLDVNILGTMYLLKAALPAMKSAYSKDGLPRSVCFTTSSGALVGVYGYAVYCATNYSIRGLAEALQMELLEDNIHVSTFLPGDVDTETGNQDRRTRPELTNIMADSTAMQTTDEVAILAIEGIKAGKFQITTSVLGQMMAIASSGFSPQRSFLMAFLEVAGAGLMRLVGLCVIASWYNTITAYKAKARRTSA
ncbi:3-dehydrosphinganine reductase TSC10A-like [Wolffia australiana]